jgi:hypothetical protein
MFEDTNAKMETMASIPETNTCVQPIVITTGSITIKGLHLQELNILLFICVG